jgi:ferrochelatase
MPIGSFRSISMTRPIGILLSNLGTPEAPTAAAVRPYLRQFLTDRRVIDIPWLPRQLLVRCIIAPFRSPRSAHAYASVWTPEGSPLMVHSLALLEAVRREVGPGFRVAMGMRYGNPSLETALAELVQAGCDEVRLLALYPQHAGATTASTLEETWRIAGRMETPPRIVPLPAFPTHAGFIEAQAETLRAALSLAPTGQTQVLFSYHGLPERQIHRGDSTGSHCLATSSCCDSLGEVNRNCYRAQCFATSRALIEALDLDPARCLTTFQSRLGRIPWIGPATDATVAALPSRGVRNLVVATPSFVTDCLETLEEVGIGLRASFLAAGGEHFSLAPCVNASPTWVKGVCDLVGASRG